MNKQEKIGLINLGCPKNLVDAEVMLGILDKEGYTITLDANEADIILVNTCSFIDKAEKESVQEVVKVAESGKKLIVTGCLAQKHKKELMEAVPEALAIVGTADISKIGEIVKNLSSEDKKCEISKNPEYNYAETVERFQITVGSSSYIKIAEGCDYNCGYCIIPALRGKYKSRAIENIVNEAKKLGEKGVNEIVLIAQDTTNYGKDIYGKPSLPELLTELNKVEEISWIRVMYAYPTLTDDSFIDAIAKLNKVVKYIDIPLQHSHPEVLKQMNRPPFDYTELIAKFRAKIPDLSIRTAFIVGYPTETEEQFEHLCNFIKENKFDKLGVFEFSKEKNTKSYTLKPQIPAKVKKERFKKLMELQQGISKEIHKNLMGKEIPTIIEAIDNKGQIVGRTYRDAPEIDGLIYIETDKSLVPGDIVNVKVTDYSEYDLYGEV